MQLHFLGKWISCDIMRGSAYKCAKLIGSQEAMQISPTEALFRHDKMKGKKIIKEELGVLDLEVISTIFIRITFFSSPLPIEILTMLNS